jgi:hypothetical protein
MWTGGNCTKRLVCNNLQSADICVTQSELIVTQL